MNINKGNKIISDIIVYDNNGNGYVFKYVLDTGADITFITENIFNLLNLVSNSSGTINNGNNTKSSVKLSNINISLPNHSGYIHVNVGVVPNKENIDVILGMDIISYCNIEIKTNTSGFDFNIELPICK